jgi:2,5-diamino-6-(ribosylamino)-4(3H)-pyrimidinone 5'-phosphate reductase
MTDARPFVTLSAAMTADGKLDTVARRGAAISSPRDAERVDRLRAESDAVMVGGHTLMGDDPRLTVKSATLRAARVAHGLSEHPIKVGLATNLASLRDDSRFLATGPARVILFTTRQTDPAQIRRLGERGAKVFVMGESKVDLGAVLRCLKGLGVERLLVEGGGTLNAELLRLGLVDEIYLYLAPLIVGGATAPTLVDGAGLERDEAIQLQLQGVETFVEGGLVVHYLVTHP